MGTDPAAGRDGSRDADCPSNAFCDPSFAEGPICFWRGTAEDGARCGRHLDCRSGRCAGLDGKAVIDVISKGAAQSWQMENRYETMLEGEFDFGFAVEWMRKDLGICLEEARRNGARLPVTALVDQFYAELQAAGHKRWDTSSLIARLESDKAIAGN